MTQVSRYGHMLKLKIEKVRARVTARYRSEGSVLKDDIQARMLGTDVALEIDSPEPPEAIARLVRTAERGCYVAQALQQPVPVTTRTRLNGHPVKL